MRCRWYNGRGGPAREPARRRKSRRAGGENTSPLGGDVSGYGTCHRRGGGGGCTDANPFRCLQYQERAERRVGIGVEEVGTVKCGFGGLPRDQVDGGNLHA